MIYLEEHFVLEFLGKLCTTQKSISLGDHVDVIPCYFLCLLVIEPEGSDIFQERMVTTDSIFKLVHGLLCVSVDLLTILIFKEHKQGIETTGNAFEAMIFIRGLPRECECRCSLDSCAIWSTEVR